MLILKVPMRWFIHRVEIICRYDTSKWTTALEAKNVLFLTFMSLWLNDVMAYKNGNTIPTSISVWTMPSG